MNCKWFLSTHFNALNEPDKGLDSADDWYKGLNLQDYGHFDSSLAVVLKPIKDTSSSISEECMMSM